MAVVFVRAGARATASPAASIAPAKPTVDGLKGVLLAVVTSKNNATHSTATPGWTLLAQTNSGASFTASLWIAAETAAAPTFTWSGSVACSAQIAYYDDLNNPLDAAAITAVSATGSGSANPHTSTSFNSTRKNSLAVYVDVAAVNTGLATPAGWTENSDTGSATDAGETTFGSKALATIGTASGAISVTGGAAAWVQWQVEILPTVANGVQVSKLEVGAWLDQMSALGFSKLEVGAWLDSGTLGFSKLEVGAWLDPGAFQISKAEVGAWLDAGAFQISKAEVGAWLDPPGTINSRRRMSLM